MRVALIDPSLFTLPYDRALAEGMLRAGHDVELHGRKLRGEDGPTSGIVPLESFYPVAGSRLGSALPSPLRLAVKGLDHLYSMNRLLRAFRRNRPDVIHFQWLPLPSLDRLHLEAFRRIAPIVLTVHDTNPFNGNPSAALQARGFRRALDRFDQLIVHTAQGEARLRVMGIPAARIAVLPHGMLMDPIPDAADLMDGPITFLLFGKIKPYKGADLLIEAFAGMSEDARAQSRLRIVGKPYMDLAPLRALAAAHDVPLAIEDGFVADDELAGLFGRGTVAMFPYREIEASGVMFLALAHGRPVIASRLGSFAEQLVDGTHGHLVPPGDIPALSAAMDHLVTNRRFAAACAAAVRQRAETVPSWDEIAGQTVRLYRTAGTASAGRGQSWYRTLPYLAELNASAVPRMSAAE